MTRGIPWLLSLLTASSLAHGAVETFVETFNGDGPYQSITNDLVGFDNPGWEVYSDDGFDGGGLHLQTNGGIEDEDTDILERTLVGAGSFVMRIDLNDLDLGEIDSESPPDSFGQIAILLRMHEDLDEGRNSIYLLISEPQTEEPVWSFGVYSSTAGGGGDVPRGPRIAMELIFDATASEAAFTYDNDTSDDNGPLLFGPFPYIGQVQESQLLTIVAASSGLGKFNGILDFLSVTPFSDVTGDFNGNGLLDAADIDLLSEQVRAATNDPLYDLNADALVNDFDRQIWIHDLKQTFFGDADLSGSFDSTDLVQVLASGEYEDDVELNSTWLTGDWDGDGDFTSGDLVVAFADGGYEVAAAVPEPAGIWLAIMGLVALSLRSRGAAANHILQHDLCVLVGQRQAPQKPQHIVLAALASNPTCCEYDRTWRCSIRPDSKTTSSFLRPATLEH